MWQALEPRLLCAATPLEQHMFELINQARSNPLAAMAQLYMDLNEGLPAGTITSTPKRQLVWNETLAQVARTFALEILATGVLTHQGVDGSWPTDRVAASGYRAVIVLENAGVTMSSAVYWDPAGVVTRQNQAYLSHAGHRVQLFYGDVSNVGIGIEIGIFAGRSALVSVIDFAKPRRTTIPPREPVSSLERSDSLWVQFSL